MKRMWIAGVLALAIAALATTPAGAARGNSQRQAVPEGRLENALSKRRLYVRQPGRLRQLRGQGQHHPDRAAQLEAGEQDGIGRFEVHDTTAFGVP